MSKKLFDVKKKITNNDNNNRQEKTTMQTKIVLRKKIKILYIYI